MTDGSSTRAEHDAVLDALERVLPRWHHGEAFAHAVTETVARHGYARSDVESQLRHVALRTRGHTMRQVLERELGGTGPFTDAPGRVLVLAAGGVPGLAIEGAVAALSVGAIAVVRPSRDETVLHHLLSTLQAEEPALARRIEVVGVGDELPWQRVDGAIVFGSDETISLVRDRLRPDAARRVAAYGSRQGIAVVDPGADADPTWAERLADDVLTFRQAGCMSPSWLYVLGAAEQGDGIIERAGRALALGTAAHIAPGVDVRAAQRRSNDADVLGAIAAGLDPSATALHAGDARLTVVCVPDPGALVHSLDGLGTLLQTAVLATSPADRAALTELLVTRTGLSRVCAPGEAHRPHPLWAQDGIGRVAPLLGR